MEEADVIEYVKRQLGFPTVTVYTDVDTIKGHVNKAFRKYKSKILPETTFTVDFNGVSKVDLSGKHIAVVLDVSPELRSTSGYSDQDFNEFTQAPLSNLLSSSSSLQDLAFYRQRQGNLQYMLGDMDWDWQDPYLYVDNVPVGSSSLTIRAMIEPVSLSEIDPDDTWIEDYALALTKIVEGRIRSKFSGGPMEFESDGSTLVDEGRTEKEQMEEALSSRAPLRGIRRG